MCILRTSVNTTVKHVAHEVVERMHSKWLTLSIDGVCVSGALSSSEEW